jgi:sec-independent protein translocase protein TatA
MLYPISLTYIYTTKKTIFMGDLFSGGHLILIILVVLLLFGGKKIPELMRGLGKGIKEFKEAKDNVCREMQDHLNNDQKAINTPVNTQVNTTIPRVVRENNSL